MEPSQLNQVLTVYAWFPLAMLISTLLLIARFYSRQTQERTYYGLFTVPIVLFGIAAAHYAVTNRVMGSPLADVLMMVGGVSLGGLCLHLYRQMTAGR
ncbi:MAG: hypothetical protein Kow0077_02810 [Anaerolineae bacterium]